MEKFVFNFDESPTSSGREMKPEYYPNSLESCRTYVKWYTFWHVYHFADRIRKTFELHFVKAIHDYFRISETRSDTFFEESYQKIDAIMKEEKLSEIQVRAKDKNWLILHYLIRLTVSLTQHHKCKRVVIICRGDCFLA